MSNFDEETMKNLINIKDYINNLYPDSYIASDELKGDGNKLLEKISDFFKFKILGFCGCGCPESTERAVRDYLYAVNMRTDEKHIKDVDERWEKARKFLNEKFEVEYVVEDPLLQFMAYTLDDAGLTDHGSSINGAWITELGKICLYVFCIETRLDNE